MIIGVEIEQETSAPPPLKKILDPPLALDSRTRKTTSTRFDFKMFFRAFSKTRYTGTNWAISHVLIGQELWFMWWWWHNKFVLLLFLFTLLRGKPSTEMNTKKKPKQKKLYGLQLVYTLRPLKLRLNNCSFKLQRDDLPTVCINMACGSTWVWSI